MIALWSTITLHQFIASTILKCLLILFPFSKSSSHSRTKDRITNRPSPPADSRLVTWDGSFSSSFLPIILKTSPHRPTGSSDQCTSPPSPLPHPTTFYVTYFLDFVLSFSLLFWISIKMYAMSGNYPGDTRTNYYLTRILLTRDTMPTKHLFLNYFTLFGCFWW